MSRFNWIEVELRAEVAETKALAAVAATNARPFKYSCGYGPQSSTTSPVLKQTTSIKTTTTKIST